MQQSPTGPEPPPEQATFLGPGGPAVAAERWAHLVLDDGDLAAAWPLTDRPLRLALAQAWILNGYTGPLRDGKDALAEALADGTSHPLWWQLAGWRIHQWRTTTLASLLPGFCLVTVPEMPAPDVALVRLAPAAGIDAMESGRPFEVQTLTMRLVDQAWLVAGVGRSLPVPGWPPSEQDVPTIHPY